MPDQPHVRLVGVTKRLGTHLAVDGISLDVAEGTFMTLLGPSGCGKTTTLRMIAGFYSPDRGEIRIRDRVINDIPPHRRNTAMVFQEYALFPHMTVAENVGYGLRMRRVPRPEARRRVALVIELVGLSGQERKFPHQLSGGQQQRVALARALIVEPEVLLLDEPLSNLDAKLRVRVRTEIRQLQQRLGKTTLYVTHDQEEALAISDQIAVMHNGRILQVGTPAEIYFHPANRFVADFVGQGVFLPAKVLNARQVEIELGTLEGNIPNACTIGCDACGKGCRADILLRPDDVVHDDAAPTQAEVVHKAFRGAEILYTLRLASGRKVLALVPSHHNHALGERIGIRLDVDHVVAFQPEP